MNKRWAVVVVGEGNVRVTFHGTWRRARGVFENLVRRERGTMCGEFEAWLGNALAYVTPE